jgi:hypothetical protein
MSRTHRAPDTEAEIPQQHRDAIGYQNEGIEAIRAVWERAGGARPAARVLRAEKGPRRMGVALPGILVCACMMLFFAWVAAPALWMTVGHVQHGTVTVTSCEDGFAPACRGVFDAGDWSRDLRLTGTVSAEDVGAELPARATGPDAGRAYVGGNLGLLLRWAPALVLFMASTFALVAVSGAQRLYERRGAATGLCWTTAAAVLACAMAFAW